MSMRVTRKYVLLLSVAPIAFASPAAARGADTAAAAAETAQSASPAEDEPASGAAAQEVFSTGVAKGRDRLDSATSTSALRASEIEKFGPRSVADILRNIPGFRSEASTGEGNANISIRGLPIASSGAKFLQLQEDGLPILEFGDIPFGTADTFLRTGLGLAAVEAIRGGSASTFASNSPGGIVNFISKTGETEGGSIQATAGLDFGLQRVDFDYGGRINPTLRFHVAGFFRQGEGPRHTGYKATRGGQIKLNVTKEFDGGYIRFYAKYLNDRTPAYDLAPIAVSGTNDDPKYSNLPNFDVRHDTLFSRNFTSFVTLDGNNNVIRDDVRDGQHPIVKSVGLESKFELAGWSVTERFRFSAMSNHYMGLYYAQFLPAPILAMAFGGPGASLRYATGPNAGQAITNAATLNGNGYAALLLLADTKLNSLDNATNDLRANRVWEVGGGDLTTTVGLYSSHQTVDSDWLWGTVLSDIRGDGEGNLLDVVTAGGVVLSQDGTYTYGSPSNAGFRRSYKVAYTTNAPFGSVNFHIGKVAIGASLRYDFGSASGSIIGSELGGGRVGVATRDMNGDGVISPAERQVSVLPLTRPAPVDYDYGYLSYSSGINYRIAEPLAVFARFSRGARANADRLLFSPIVSTADGHLADEGAAIDYVHQAEGGVKYRNSDLTANLTAFWAKAEDTNLDATTGQPISRLYRAIGLEFEGSYRTGPFSLTAGATYTRAKIVRDRLNPALEGNVPHRQADLIFQAMPQFTTDRFSVGAVFIGTTGSYATDSNQLKVPGFVTTNAFVQFRPVERVTLSVNASNLFDVLALTAVDDPVATVGVARSHVLNGRTVSASVRLDF